MDIIELTVDNVAFYSELVDRNAAENLERRSYFGAVAVNEGKPLAAMIWQIEKGTTAEIVWLKVTDDVAAKELITDYSMRVREAGVKLSYFVFDKDTCKASIEVLGECGFTLSEAEGNDLITSVGSLISLPIARIKGNDDNIYELGTLKKRAFGEVIKDCFANSKRDLSDALFAIGREWFEPEISCYSENDCIINGMLLVHKLPDGALRLELLSSWGTAEETELAQMIKHAIATALELYPADTQVIIHRHDKASRKLSTYCLPKLKGRPSIYGKREEVE